jgi:hypothetical protein
VCFHEEDRSIDRSIDGVQGGNCFSSRESYETYKFRQSYETYKFSHTKHTNSDNRTKHTYSITLNIQIQSYETYKFRHRAARALATEI